MKFKNIKNNNGFAVITTVIFFLIISVAVISAVVIPTSNQVKSVLELLKSRQGYLAADSINDDVYYRLKLGKTIPSTISLPFSNGVSASANVTMSGSSGQVTSTGVDGDTSRYSQTYFSSTGKVLGFPFGAEIGTGGMSITGGSYVIGDVYSNGSVTSDGSGPNISGSLTVANGVPPTVNQTNSYTNGTSPISVDMGKVSGTQDLAQSFKVTDSTVLTSVRLYIKKTITGSPADATIRIVPDLSGSPSNTGTLGTGTLSASAVTTSFTYVNIPIAQAPSLTPGATYWLVIDTPSVSTSKYFTLAGTNNTYANGVGMVGSWNSNKNKNTWTSISPANTDLYFDIYLGGLINSISGGGQWNRINIGTSGSGFAWANNINSVSVKGAIYCQTGTYLYDSNNTAKTCDTSRTDPTPLPYPITDQNITDWKAVAATGGSYNGTYNLDGGLNASIGPKKIAGDLNVTGGSILSLTGTVWVTGNINLGGGSVIKLASAGGTSDGMIIADGTISVTGGSSFQGSGTTGSYMVAMTTNTSSSAFTISGGSGSVVTFAPYGTLNVNGGAVVNSAVAKQFILDGGSGVNYDTGLSSIDFITSGVTSGGSGSNWKVNSWSEVTQ